MLLLDEHRSVPWTIEREREGERERKKEVRVPLGATKVPVAMADIRAIGRAFFSFFVLSSPGRKKRRKKNYEMFMIDSLSLTSKEGLLSLVYMYPFIDLCFFPVFSKKCCVVVIVCVMSTIIVELWLARPLLRVVNFFLQPIV
jgi:hypothetical protein